MTPTLTLAAGAVLITLVAANLFIWSAMTLDHDKWLALMFFILAVLLTAGLALIGVNVP